MFFLQRLILLSVCIALFGTYSAILEAADENTQLCVDVLQVAQQANPRQLWKGASECGRSGDMDSATFLLLAGQVRAMTDMGMLKAASDQDKVKRRELFGALYYQYGGSGDYEIYRNPDRSLKIFDRLREWKPTLDGTYDPGWDYKSRVDASQYDQMAACQKAVRIQKLSWYANLIGNDEYYAAHSELNKLRAANLGAIVVGSELDKKMAPLRARMESVSKRNSMPTKQPEECDFE